MQSLHLHCVNFFSSGEEQTKETTPVDEEPLEMTLEEYRAKNPTVSTLRTCNYATIGSDSQYNETARVL